MSKRNTIKINGKHYDAVTGQPIGHGEALAPRPAHKPALKAAVKRPTMHDVVRHTAKPAPGHKPETSNTLMRQAVRKPDPVKRQLKVQAVTSAASTLAAVAPKTSVSQVHPAKLHKAKHVPKSHLISHFSPSVMQPSLPVYVPPTPVESARPLAIQAHNHKPVSKAKKPQTTAELLDRALQSADSHTHTTTKRRQGKHRKLATASAAAVVAMAVIGLTQLQSLQLHMASAKAGFAAALPSYRPAGYSLQKLDSGPGAVASAFHSNSDDRNYTVTEKQSDWTSDELRDDFVAKADPGFQIANVAGRTVFLYDNGSATWVDSGVWYVVQSHGALSSRQLTDLAASL